MSSKKLVYFFGISEKDGNVKNLTEGNKDMKEILGGKGAGLAEMSSMGIRVPQGFTISTEACKQFSDLPLFSNVKTKIAEVDANTVLSKELIDQIEENLKKLELVAKGSFAGDENDKLILVSVRSGAAVSLPGMMDTVLNLGLNDKRVLQFAAQTNNERVAWDSYRRLLQMFGEVVLGADSEKFEEVLTKKKANKNLRFDNELTVEDLKFIVAEYKDIIVSETGTPFPQDPKKQLYLAILSVFRSWNNSRAKEYRRINRIGNLIGTAVNVQLMVFGNLNEDSGTGVAFSRSPATGENKFYGEFLRNAQGEDVVAGVRTPQEIDELAQKFPKCYQELVEIYHKLEQRFKDMQDMEFTIQDKTLYMLQTRNGKRTMVAAVQMAYDMVSEGLIDEKTALLRLDASQVDQLLHKHLDPNDKKAHAVAGQGLPASPGAAVGRIAFSSNQAVEMSKDGPVILVRKDTSAEDLIGMNVAQGILTQNGGRTSHAAVVARGMGKPAVAGCQEAKIDEHSETLVLRKNTYRKGDFISIDGTTGEVFHGKIKTVLPEFTPAFKQILVWEKKYRNLGVRSNADTVKDTFKSVEFDADGIGLCRVEHMFFQKDRLRYMREMILAKDAQGRETALAQIKPYLKEDFLEMFKLLNGKPFTIRLLDPPLHEFLPSDEEAKMEISMELSISINDIQAKVDKMKEFNPMIGCRGVRVGMLYPEITRMQAEAFFEAAAYVQTQLKITVHPEVMVPMVSTVKELQFQKSIVFNAAEQILKPCSIKFKYGTMIETPRAAMTSTQIAEEAEFFSFGSNDLTQLCFGFSRDDAPKWVPSYIEKGILEHDPFAVLDQMGVGQLIQTSLQKGRSTRANLLVGLCGEHGGESSSIEFLHKSGLDYVSCSPFRILNARLAACQAAIKHPRSVVLANHNV